MYPFSHFFRIVCVSIVLFHGTLQAQVYSTWTSTYARAFSPQNQLTAATGDGTNAVYSLCNTMNTSGQSEITVFKTDLEGLQGWAVSLTNELDVIDATGQCIDVKNARIAAGASVVLSSGHTNSLLVLIDENGTVLWAQRFLPSNTLSCAASAVHIQPSGRVILGGSAGDPAFLAAFDSNGQLLWERKHSGYGGVGASSTTNICISIQSDPGENIYVLAQTRYWRGIPWNEASFWSYDADGEPRWDAGYVFDSFWIDPEGYIYGARSGYYGVASKYDTNGVVLWTNTFGIGITQYRQNNEVRNTHPGPDGEGMICTCQYYNGKQKRYSAARLSAQGDLIWDFINGPHELNGSWQLVHDSAVDPAGNTIIAGNQSTFIISPAGKKLLETDPHGMHLSCFGELDIICGTETVSSSSQVVEQVRMSRFPSFSSSSFGVYDMGMKPDCDLYWFSVPSTNGLLLRGEFSTNLVDGTWTTMPYSWIGTSVITTVAWTNPPSNAILRIIAEPVQ